MSNWPFFSQTTEEVLGISGTSAAGLVNSSANDYGSWTEIGTLAQEADALQVLMTGGGTTTAGTIFELALDSSGVNKIAAHIGLGRLSAGHSGCITLPLHVSAGATIYGRAMCSAATTSFTSIRCLRGGWLNPAGWARCESLSGEPANANTPGANCGLANVWTEVVAATSRAYGALATICGASSTLTGRTTQVVIGQIAVGEAASETVIADKIAFRSGDARIGPVGLIAIPSPIPSGVRVAVRAVGGSNTTNAFSVDVIGFY